MDNKKIGENINTYRKVKKLTQKQLADLIDKAESSVQKYEKGETEVPISVLEKISTVLDIPLQCLLDWTKQEFINNALGGIDQEFEQLITSLGYKLIYRPEATNNKPITLVDTTEHSTSITLEEIKELSHSTKSYLNFKIHELFQARS
ncbi:MAG: helix-turn-helix transcriptional regulator [Dorea sp.]|nr:helix-turn-helix transcriptional regulator [Dorea sp.]